MRPCPQATCGGYAESTCHNALTTGGRSTGSHVEEDRPLEPRHRARPLRATTPKIGATAAGSTSVTSARSCVTSKGYRAGVAILALTGCGSPRRAPFAGRTSISSTRAPGLRAVTRATRKRPARIVPRKRTRRRSRLHLPGGRAHPRRALAVEQNAGRGRDSDYVLATRSGLPQAQRNLAQAVERAASRPGCRE